MNGRYSLLYSQKLLQLRSGLQMERSSHLETSSASLALVEPPGIELLFCRLPPRLSSSLFSSNGEEFLQEYYPDFRYINTTFGSTENLGFSEPPNMRILCLEQLSDLSWSPPSYT
jgi:hypothetical protein